MAVLRRHARERKAFLAHSEVVGTRRDVGKRVAPGLVAVTLVIELVESSVSFTVAPGMAAPCWSVTWPETTPVAAFCALAGAAARTNIMAAQIGTSAERKNRAPKEDNVFREFIPTPHSTKSKLPTRFVRTMPG